MSIAKGTLSTSLQVKNTGSESFNFQTLLHTYLRVSDVSKSYVDGLDASNFINQLEVEQGDCTQNGTLALGGQEIDRIYTMPSTDNLLLQPEGIKVSVNDVLPQVVVWNPWIEKSKRLGDFPDDGYQFMVCIEPGLVRGSQSLDPNQSWTATQTLISSSF